MCYLPTVEVFSHSFALAAPLGDPGVAFLLLLEFRRRRFPLFLVRQLLLAFPLVQLLSLLPTQSLQILVPLLVGLHLGRVLTCPNINQFKYKTASTSISFSDFGFS
jgi:hypothetical protein